MSNKTEQKKQLILERAARIFSEKGYGTVSMKDIVEAAEISRGGLYLYFASVEEIFLAVLEEADKKNDLELPQELLAKSTNTELLLYFFKTQKKQMLNKKGNLLTAKLQYAFECRKQKKESPLKKEMDAERLILQKLLERGNESGEFNCYDTKREAASIMMALQGMKLMACTTGISEKKIDEEFLYLMQGFIDED